MVETKQQTDPKSAAVPQTARVKAPVKENARREDDMHSFICDEEMLDSVENRRRTRGDMWRTDLFIVGTCMVIVFMVIAVALAWTGRIHV